MKKTTIAAICAMAVMGAVAPVHADSMWRTMPYSSDQSTSTDDSTLRQRIEQAVSNSNVSVSVDNGKVTLKGTVASETAKRGLESMVSRVPGVKSVDNQLTVSPAQNSMQYMQRDSQTMPRSQGY